MKTFQIDTSDGFKIAVTSFGENNATKKIIVKLERMPSVFFMPNMQRI